jgi:dolichyl-phosphate-mannose-protein mannosyltransferase
MSLERLFWVLAFGIVAGAGTWEVSSALGETQTWDEGIHLSAGYAYLTRGDYRWNPEHPPLAKLMSALPLSFLHLDLPVRGDGWQKGDETRVGIDFLYHNRTPADSILLASRGMTILLSLLFLLSVAWWTRRRFGPAPALLALCLCAFDPNLLAHGRYVTTDFPVTVFYFLACALSVDYLLSGRFRDLAPAALAFALAIVTKFSAVLLIPTLPALYALRWWQSPREFSWRRLLTAAALFFAFTLVMVNIVYWPETVRCWTTHVPPLTQEVKPDGLVGNILYRAGKWMHLPAHTFLVGLNKVAAHNREGHSSYLLGMRSDQGWWYYFPVVFAVKSTMAALAATLLLLAAGLGIIWRVRRIDFVWLGLLIPPLIYFLFSMTSAINIGMRHILPVYPFLYVAAAALLAQAFPKRAARWLMMALAALQVAECASIAPDFLAFFNALSGGPGNGPRYLVDSNIDWGQDMKKLVKWLDARGTRAAYLMYFGNAQAPAYGLQVLNYPGALDKAGWDALDGFAAASVTPLQGVYLPLDALARLRLREPVAKIGWSLYVYDFRQRPAP